MFWSGLLLIVFPFPLIWSLPTLDLGKWLALVPKNRLDHVAFGLLPPDLTNLLQNETGKRWIKASSGQELICGKYHHEFLSFTYSNLLFCQVVHHHYHLGKRGQTVMTHNDSPTWLRWIKGSIMSSRERLRWSHYDKNHQRHACHAYELLRFRGTLVQGLIDVWAAWFHHANNT